LLEIVFARQRQQRLASEKIKIKRPEYGFKVQKHRARTSG
jgi:hypothetical protein